MAPYTTTRIACSKGARVACTLGLTTLALACASGGGAAGTDHRTNASAGVLLDDHLTTYAVRGRTIAEIRQSLATAAPEATGHNAVGYDTWHLAWRWRTVAGGGLGCELRDVVVTVSSTIVVPAWVPDSTAEPGVAERWAAYDAALRRHERGHEVLAADAGSSLVQTLRRVRATRCADANAEGNRYGHEAVDALNSAERAYELSTGHGRTQGVTWPPPLVPAPAAVH